MAKSSQVWIDKAIQLGASKEAIANLDWNSFFLNNLVPVTLGNIVGGVFFVGTIYWVIYLRKSKEVKNDNTYVNNTLKA